MFNLTTLASDRSSQASGARIRTYWLQPGDWGEKESLQAACLVGPIDLLAVEFMNMQLLTAGCYVIHSIRSSLLV